MNKNLSTRETGLTNTSNLSNITRNARPAYAYAIYPNMGYVTGRLLREAWNGIWGYFFPPPPPKPVNYNKLYRARMESFAKCRLQHSNHLSTEKIAGLFKQYLKDLLPFEKKQLSRAHEDLYNILKRSHCRNEQQLHNIVEQVPEFKKYYKADQKIAHNEKMRRFETKFKAVFPRHKTYDETANYIKRFLSNLTPYEHKNKEKAHKKVLAILKETVRENLGNCERDTNNCAWEIGRYTTRIPELDPLHQPSSYSYIDGATWSQVGVKSLSKEAQLEAMKLTRAAYDAKPDATEIELIKMLYPEPIRRIFGDDEKGAEVIAQIPVIVGADTGGYVDYFESKDLTHNVMRGLDKYRPFIVFCVQNSRGEEVAETVFQRYQYGPNNWAIGCHKINHLFRRSDPLDERNIEYGQRLVKGEPCGIRYPDGERQLTNDQGDSTISLCTRNRN